MKGSALLLSGLLAFAVAPEALADGRKPGSVLIYPIHRSGFLTPQQGGKPGFGTLFFTIISVTNTNLQPITPINGLGGSTDVHFEYVNLTPNPDPLLSYFPTCSVANVTERLTPADTRSVLTSCHNAANFQEGYLVISAEDPNKGPQGDPVPWSFDHLLGSEIVVTSLGGMYSLNAIPFKAGSKIIALGPTDADGDEELDFDGTEYEQMPDELYIDSFLALGGSSLILMNFTGGNAFTANVDIDIWNDNEQAMSQTVAFRCWFEERLDNVSLFFTEPFLLINTPNDPSELDLDCDGLADLETGWARLRGDNASSTVESIDDCALLGAITAGPGGKNVLINGGHLLWESVATQDNGDFFKTGTDDPEN
jgi:hypothetical protein